MSGRPLRLTTVSLVTTAVLVVVAVAVFAASALSLEGLTQARHRESAVVDAAVASSSDLFDLYLNQETGLRGYLTTGDPQLLAPYQSTEPRILPAEATLARLVTSIPMAQSELAQVVAAHTEWVDRYAEPAIAEVAAHNMAAAQNDMSVLNGKNLFDAIRNDMRALNATIATTQHAIEQTVGTRRNQLWVVLAISLVALLLAALATAVVNRRLVIEPLAALGRQVAVVAGGDLEHHLDSDGPEEIRALAGAVEVMRARLAGSIDDARRSTEALAQEGPAVTALRQALSPLPTSLAGIDIAGRLQPAHGVLAGDWWDTFALSGQRSALVVGDVSGHGAAAGVYAFQLKHLIALALRAGLDPGAALAAALAETVSSSDELFATALVAVLDPIRGQVAYASAGHPDALILQDRVVQLPQTGPLLSAVVAARQWECHVENVASGDLLVAVTDGVTEARDDSGEQFGTARLVAAVAANKNREPAAIATDVLQRVNGFARRGQAADDRTIIVARITGDIGRYPVSTGERASVT
ncbi:MAG: PP2C family protein-serine/threonine phosphatase [Acidimicrobiales bacterium]